ncbi:MAG: BatA domain-containing protein [Gemmatimonadota bacterium]
MGALNPLFLLAGLSIAIPIYLHLFHRHQARRLSFPALRYLERTEREHARQIRLRQILLMLARVLALLLVVGAGSRLFFGGRGASHPPTAAVIVIDNSLSSGLVVGEVRVLDELKRLANLTLDAAQEEDRFWVIRAGEPWLPALPGGPAEARRAIDEVEASEARGDLTEALSRAARLLEEAPLEHREIHLLSDLQATAFAGASGTPVDSLPVVVWEGHRAEAANRALSDVVVGGGLPPLEGQRTDVTIAALESAGDGDTLHVPIRLVVNERIRGAATIPPGAQTTIAMPPSGTGWIQGYVDADPDDLRADDRRFFAYRSRSAPVVAVAGDPGLFVREALGVLQEAGRVRTGALAQADLLLSDAATALPDAASGTAVLIVPPADPTLLPAVNQRLGAAGVPWRLEPAGTRGRAPVEGLNVPDALRDVVADTPYGLALAGDPNQPTRTLAEVGGTPWLVEGTDQGGRRFLLVGSPLDANGTSLPVSTGMLRFVDWVASDWAAAGGGATRWTTGGHLSAPSSATHVRFPSGEEQEIDGTRMVRGTGRAGLYTFTATDSVVSVVAVNPPVEESRLDPLPDASYASVIGGDAVSASSESEWARSVFQARQGPELWWPFLLAVLALLALEALMATSGERGPFGRTGDRDE